MSVLFLAVADALSAIGMILVSIIIAGYVKLIRRIRKRRVLLLTLTAGLMLIYAGGFLGWSFYNSTRFENAYSFLRFCPTLTAFFFLQSVRFTADVFFGKIPSSIGVNDIFGYLLFYPRLVMGPVMTYDEHKAMLAEGSYCSERIGEGLGLFIKGLSKKLLLADTIGMVFLPLYGVTGNDASIVISWITVLAFSLQLYFTVAGYGDMAKGIALCYGFRIPDSYKTPLFSGSLSRFGSEWNMSVVSWFRGCFAPILKVDRWQSIIGMTAVWTILGFWYRPEPQVIIWGVWMGLWIGLDQYFRNKFRRIPSLFYAMAFFFVTFFGWTFFSADSVMEGVRLLGQLFGSGASIVKAQDLYYISSGGLILIVAAYSATGNFGAILGRIRRIPILSKLSELMSIPLQLLLLFLCIVVLVTQNDISVLQLKGAV